MSTEYGRPRYLRWPSVSHISAFRARPLSLSLSLFFFFFLFCFSLFLFFSLAGPFSPIPLLYLHPPVTLRGVRARVSLSVFECPTNGVVVVVAATYSFSRL